MYDVGPPARRGTATLITWFVASLLVFGALVSMLWLFAQDGVRSPVTADPAGSSASPDPSPDESGAQQVSAGPSAAPSPTPSSPPPEIAIRGEGSGRCLDVPGANLADGVTLQIYDCNDTVAQRWTVTGSGQLRIGDRCLDDPSGGVDGVAVAIDTCHGGDDQRWRTPGDGTVRNVATDLCLDVEGGEVENGTPVLVYSCHQQPHQLWTIG